MLVDIVVSVLVPAVVLAVALLRRGGEENTEGMYRYCLTGLQWLLNVPSSFCGSMFTALSA